MNISMKVALAAGVVLAGGASAWIVGAQSPAKPKVVQVAANNTPAPADSRRAAPKAAVPAAAAPAQPEAPKAASEVLITRETFAYTGSGRRDPFGSLMNTEELRPLLTDLRLVAVAFDPTGRNSVAVLRDQSDKQQYRVKVGQEIGRMRVASIREKNVVFGIEEFGYSRQETLGISDSTKVRTQ